MHSIRSQITAITILAVLTSIVCVFAAGFVILKSETDRNSVGMMNLIDEDTQKSLEKYFESIEQSVEIAANIAVEDLDSVFLVENGAIRSETEPAEQSGEQVAALDAYLGDYCARIQKYFSAVADYTQGVTAYYYCINPEIGSSEAGFFYMKIGKTGFIRQTPLDVRGLQSLEALGKTWYEAAVEKGRPAWIGPYPSTSEHNIWICSYFVPIYKSGRLIGLMGMDIPCETLIEQINAIRVYDTGYVCLLDADNRVIYHPELPIASSLDELGLSVHPEMMLKGNSGDELIRYTAKGEERQMSFSTLSNGMKLACIAPAREIAAPWIRLIRAIMVITAFIVVVFVLIIWLLMGVITNPLRELTDASQRLADADYDVDLNYQGKNEIGKLTGAFTRMRDQLRRYIGDLNHQLYYDRLTDLPNMRRFFTLAEEERQRLLKEGRHTVMVYFNMIGLRYYNRQCGFVKGDQVIVNLANILKEQFGENRVCRFNGDHFAAVTDEEHVEEELQAVLQKCENAADGIQLNVRIGVYPNRLEEVDVNIACDRAKAACDQNRGSLSSSINYFSEEMLKTGEVYRHIVNSLDQALAEGWVKVYYQPIIRAADGKVCDEEALARWIDPKLGFLSPADFIPALENSKLIYKLDLYVLEQVLEKMKRQVELGHYLVPQSINLSRMDFESCDVVEEFRRRVDAAGIERAMITVEITESVIGSDFDFMKEQIVRFRQMGFPVWMDDFGSGYSSLDVLQQLHFDLIKFDMRFMESFDEGDESKIILTELMNMAIGLGMETVCEGVETAEQAEFLREIGCTRIQGYYYGKPQPFEKVLSLIAEGSALEFENPAEAEYYSAIGRINLYDITALANENDETLTQYFNTLPMCIMEVHDDSVRYSRCNRSYRVFLERTMGMPYSAEAIDCTKLEAGPGASFLKAVVQCGKEGSRTVLDERLDAHTVAHTLIRRVAVNPVTGTAAVAVAVLAVIREDENAGTSYSQMAKALAADYVNLYYVDLNTEHFIEYSPDAKLEDLSMERHGENFFASARKDALLYLYLEDQESFIREFTKENVVGALDSEGKFKINYRLLLDGEPSWVEMKAVRLQGDMRHIIIAVNNVDAQMREKEMLNRIQTEKTVYSRISALTRDFICLYTIDPETSRFTEYRASSDYAGLGVPTEGEDFFAQSRKESERLIDPEDLPKFQSLLTRENVLAEVEKNGFFSFRYRMLMDGKPRYLSLRATMVEEQGKSVLLIGVIDIDAQMRREQDYEQKLYSARRKANLDTLTGVKNKAAYETMSEHLTRQIEEGQRAQYAIVLCRVEELAQINETQGREAGDQLIRSACRIICDTFKHSPVFRMDADKFAVIAQGRDYAHIEALIAQIEQRGRENAAEISCGMARCDGTESVAAVFASAEQRCGESPKGG